MTKTELIAAIAERTGVSKVDVDATIVGFFDEVAGVVAKGEDKVTIPGWISFERTNRAARTGRNPRTGEAIDIPASFAVKVTAGSKLKAIAKGDAPAPR